MVVRSELWVRQVHDASGYFVSSYPEHAATPQLVQWVSAKMGWTPVEKLSVPLPNP